MRSNVASENDRNKSIANFLSKIKIFLQLFLLCHHLHSKFSFKNLHANMCTEIYFENAEKNSYRETKWKLGSEEKALIKKNKELLR